MLIPFFYLYIYDRINNNYSINRKKKNNNNSITK